MSFKKFEREFDKATSVIITGSNTVIKKTAEALLTDIIMSTPVESGQLRGNWLTTLDNPDVSTSLKGTTDKSGFKTIGNSRQVLRSFSINKGNSKIYMSNNLEYANKIEFGQHSQQAPYGMVRINIVKFDQLLNKEAKKYKI